MVLGGTKQQGNFSKEINLDDKNHILRETLLIEPRLKVNNLTAPYALTFDMLKIRLGGGGAFQESRRGSHFTTSQQSTQLSILPISVNEYSEVILRTQVLDTH